MIHRATIGILATGGLAIAVGLLLATTPPYMDPEFDVGAAPGQNSERSSDFATGASEPRVANDAPAVAKQRGVWGAAAGTRLQFKIAVHNETRIESDQGTDTQLRFDITGTMMQHVIARRDGDALVAVSFPNCRVDMSAAGADQAAPGRALADDLARTTIVRMAEDGATVGYRFDAGLALENRGWIRSLVSAFRFVVPVDAGTSWQTEEIDATGSFQMDYRAVRSSDSPEPLIIEKSKRAFAGVGEDHAVQLRDVRGLGKGRFDPAIGWLRQASFTEDLGGNTLDGAMRFGASFRATAELSQDTVQPVATDDSDWNGPWDAIDGSAEAAAIAARSAERRFRSELAGTSVQELLADVRELVVHEDYDSHALLVLKEKIAWLIRMRPESLGPIEAMLRSRLQQRAELALLVAVGMADTDEAHRTLAGLLGDSSGREELRLHVALAMFRLTNPAPEVRNAVKTLLADETAAIELRRTGVMLLGSLAAQKTPGRAVDYLEPLLAFEKEAADRGMTTAWLLALANTESPAAIVRAQPYTGHADPGVRASAMMALGHASSPQATESLAKALRFDASVEVRGAAAAGLAQHGSPAAFAVLAKLIPREPEASVRGAALAALVEHVRAAGAKRILESIARNDVSDDLRRRADRLLRRGG